MTSNQIALINARETKRHNLYTEAETARANSLNFEMSRRNMENQKEIAVLNNSTNLAIAQQNQANQRYIAELDSQTRRYTAEVAANNALNVAAINADTQRYVSQLNAQTSVQNTSATLNERIFEANLKHSEYERSQGETERHNVRDESNTQNKTVASVIGSVLNAGASLAKFALLPLGI